jgi:hypothetical protein
MTDTEIIEYLESSSEARAKVRAELLTYLAELEQLSSPRFMIVCYSSLDYSPIKLDIEHNRYCAFTGEIALFHDRAEARRVAKYFSDKARTYETATFEAWKAARIDAIKTVIADITI